VEVFKKFIEQGLDYGGDTAEYYWCIQNECSSVEFDRLSKRQSEWASKLPPKR
jgi:hypothetical protein